MNTATTTGTKTGTTGRRRVGRLISSSSKMALVGIMASAATIGFTLWIQYIMVRQRNVGEPLVRTSMTLQRLLDRSLVELRGWIAYGDPKAKQARRQLWNEDITKTLDELERAAQTLQAKAVLDDYAALRMRLRRLRYLQWFVEDIARTPTNESARRTYASVLRPLADQIEPHLGAVSVPVPGGATAAGEAQELLTAFLATDRAVIALLDAGSVDLATATRRKAERLSALATAIVNGWPARKTDFVTAEFLLEGAREARAYAARVPRVVELRIRDDWNLSETTYREQLKPLQREVAALAQKISQDQLAFVKQQARGLMRWSFVVLGLALLLGGLSVAAAYVNYRLEYRVERALAKASSLGKYVIEGRIGGGGMGEVFRAKHALLRRPSAVKVLRIDQMLDLDAQERFENEVRLTSQLTHPNTIAIFDYGRTDEGLFYYAMELLDGVGLDTLVAISGPQPPSRVVHILRQICASLHEAHEQGLLHRDVKPSNVMLAKLGGVADWVKVLDFGLATRIRRPATRAVENTVVGTPAYIAPEVIMSPDGAGPRADLYAVGAVGYFLVTGENVFDRETVAEVLDAHLHDQPEPPSTRLGVDTLPESLELLVLSCLAKDPGDRPKSAAELARMLDEVDVEEWTPASAQAWWDEYGEAAVAAARAEPESKRGSMASLGAPRGLEPLRSVSP